MSDDPCLLAESARAIAVNTARVGEHPDYIYNALMDFANAIIEKSRQPPTQVNHDK